MPASSARAVHTTIDLSLWIQVLTGIVGVVGLLGYELQGPHAILKAVLLLETFVQAVEFAFYLLLIRKMAVADMAAARYFDWFITTPTMLLTTAVYMAYETAVERGKAAGREPETIEFWAFVKDERRPLAIVAASNAGMLIAGYLGEIGVVDRWTAVAAGFACFGVSFAVLWTEYARHSEAGRRLFGFLLVVWGMYGIAFMMSPAAKNVAFNCLDIVAKNFFGLFLFFKIRSVAQAQQLQARAQDQAQKLL